MRTQVSSALGILGTGDNSVICALGILGTGEDSVILAVDTHGTVRSCESWDWRGLKLFPLLVPVELARSQPCQLVILLGLARTQVIAALGALGNWRGLSFLVLGTPRTGEDSTHFRSWYMWDWRGLSLFSSWYSRDWRGLSRSSSWRPRDFVLPSDCCRRVIGTEDWRWYSDCLVQVSSPPLFKSR